MANAMPTRHNNGDHNATCSIKIVTTTHTWHNNGDCDTYMVSWTQSTTSSFQSSKSKVPQVNQVTRPARDSEKLRTRAQASGDLVTRDQTKSKSPDTPCDLSRVITCDKSRDPIRFGRARSPLINRWQTVGTVCNQQRHVTPVIG